MSSNVSSLVSFQSLEALESRLLRIESILYGSSTYSQTEGKDFYTRLTLLSNSLSNIESTYFSQSTNSSASCLSIYKKLKPLFNSNPNNLNLTNILTTILTNISSVQLQVETVKATASKLLSLRDQLEETQKVNLMIPAISSEEEECLSKCLALVEEILPQVYCQSKEIDEIIDLYEKGVSFSLSLSFSI